MAARKVWLSKPAAAAILGITATHLDRFWRPLLPEGSEKKDGRTLLIDGHALVSVYAATRQKDQPAKDADAPDWDARYRQEKALLARMERLEKQRTLVAVDRIRDGIIFVFGIIKSAGDVLQKRFGSEAFEILDEAFEEAGRAVGDRFAGDDGIGTELHP